jgi:Leucine-rich repeat (LRR) protein
VIQLARTGLQYLGLSNNKFTGSLPNQVSNLPMLEYLYLDSNAFTGTIPTNLGRMSKFK